MAPTLYGLIRSINVLGESLGSSLISVLLKRLRFIFFSCTSACSIPERRTKPDLARCGDEEGSDKMGCTTHAIFERTTLCEGFFVPEHFRLTDNSHGKQP